MSNIDFDAINRKVSDYVQTLSGDVSLRRLFSDQFITQHSKFSNADNFFGPTGISTQDSYEAWAETKADAYTKSNTDFSSWKEMLTAAAVEFVHAKMQMLQDGTWIDESFTQEPGLSNIKIQIRF